MAKTQKPSFASIGAYAVQLVCRLPAVPCTRTTGVGCSAVGRHDQSLLPGADPPGLVNSGMTPERKVSGSGRGAAPAAPVLQNNAAAEINEPITIRQRMTLPLKLLPRPPARSRG